MAKRTSKKKDKKVDENQQDPGTENTNPNDTGEAGENQSTLEYVGPNYRKYILMYPDEQIDPRAMDAEQIEATIKKYPRTEAWWKS